MATLNMATLNVNGRNVEVTAEADTPLLWVLREHLKLTGTKFGCGMAQCGACTVHLNGKPARSCVTPLSAVGALRVTTIEGLSADTHLHPLQQAWIEEQVPQCGYCQSGQIMSAAALLAKNPKPSRRQIVQAMNGNLCRCGTYSHIVSAIQRAARAMAAGRAASAPKTAAQSSDPGAAFVQVSANNIEK